MLRLFLICEDIAKYGSKHQTVQDIQKTLARVKAMLAQQQVEDTKQQEEDILSALNDLGMLALYVFVSLPYSQRGHLRRRSNIP